VALRYSLLVASCLIASAPAFAQTPPATGQGHGMMRSACKADVTALCKDVQPGGGRIKECLKSNWDKVSQGCKDAIATAKAAHAGQGAAGGTGTAAPPQ
jgi:hypothetical protein